MLFLQAIQSQTVGQAVNITTDGQIVNLAIDVEAVNTSTVGQAANATIGQDVNISVGWQNDKMATGEKAVNIASIGHVVNMTRIEQVVNLTTIAQTIGMTTIEPTPNMTTDSAIDIQTANMTTVRNLVIIDIPYHAVGTLLRCTVNILHLGCIFTLQTPPSPSTKRFLKIYISEVALSEYIILSKLFPLNNGANYVHINQTCECFQYVVENGEWYLSWYGYQTIVLEFSTLGYQESEEYPYCHLQVCNITTMNYNDQSCTTQVIYYDDIMTCHEFFTEIQYTKRRAVAYEYFDCVLSCTQNCTCTLGNAKLISECGDGIAHSSLIVLQLADKRSLRLFFSSTIMYLDNNAFLMVNEIEELHLSYGGFPKIDLGAFSGLKRLHHLYLDHNNLLEIQRGLFNHLYNLMSLDFSWNSIQWIPRGLFNHLHNLIRLDLSHNNIRWIQRGLFNHLNNLISLDVSWNNIRCISFDSFEGL